MPTLTKKHEQALSTFISRYAKDSNVVGILLCGSAVHSTLDKNSDLDVHIVMKSGNWRERGNTWVGDVEVEYLINPISQIRAYFKNERQPHTAEMFQTGVVLYRNGPVMDQLIAEAKKVRKQGLAPIGKAEQELAKYHLNDLYKDLDDVYVRKDGFAFDLIAPQVLQYSLETFLAARRMKLEKPKRMNAYLKKIDAPFAALFSKAASEKDQKKRFAAITKVVSHVEKEIGKRPKEWKLRGPLQH